MKTEQIMAALSAKFSPPQWAYLPQVPDSTGGPASRTADAIAMSVWPSRGLELHGIEVKTYRGDWLKELKNPAKAEAICKFCDRWWLAIGDASIIRDGELPATWGLMVPRGDEMIIKVQAPQLEATHVDRNFLAALLRQAANVIVPKDSIAAQLSDEYQRGEKAGKKSIAQRVEHSEAIQKKLEETIANFEQASGLSISSWNAGAIGAAVKAYMDDPSQRLRAELQRSHDRAREICDALARGLSEWPIKPETEVAKTA
jgi:hypothetical protein